MCISCIYFHLRFLQEKKKNSTCDAAPLQSVTSGVRGREVALLERSCEMENNDEGRQVLSALAQEVSLMNFKTYFAVEGLINDHVHEGPSLLLLPSGSPHKFSHIS